jgi:hypothetical protein
MSGLFLILALAFGVPLVALAALPAVYDIAAGDADPTTQGWTASEVLVDSDGTVDTGNAGRVSATPLPGFAWQIFDRLSTAAFDSPGYQQTLTTAEQNDLIENGWQFEVVVRPIQQNNTSDPFAGFAGWGLDAAAAAANGQPHRCGFYIQVGAGNAFEVRGTDGNLVTLEAGSASSYHTVTAQGYPGKTSYRWLIDGVFRHELDFLDNTTSGSAVNFVAGTSAGTGGRANWTQVSLRRAGSLPPKILYVNKAVTGGAGDGSSWANAYAELRDALGAADGAGPTAERHRRCISAAMPRPTLLLRKPRRSP